MVLNIKKAEERYRIMSKLIEEMKLRKYFLFFHNNRFRCKKDS